MERPPTFQRVEIVDGVDLHVADAPWFQTIAVKLRFSEPIDRRAAARALILGLLRRGCRNAPDLMSLARRLESLFGAAIAFDSERIGQVQTSDFTLRVIRPGKATGSESLLHDGLATLDELVRDPVVEDGGFRRAEFAQERLNLERSIRALLDDKASHAQRRFLALTFPGEPYGEPELGSLEDLPALDPVDLLRQHRERIATARLRLFAIGDLSESARRAVIELGRSYGARKVIERAESNPRPAGPRRHVEDIEAGESHLFLGYRFDPAGLEPREALAYSIAASILGGGPYSLLFREVRERRQLAYATHAHLDRPKGLLTLYAAIDRSTFDQATETMREQVRRLAAGGFDDAILAAAREALDHALRTALDSPLRAIDFAARALASGFAPDPAVYAESLSRVTRDDVIRAASSLREDVTYLASGCADDRDTESAR